MSKEPLISRESLQRESKLLEQLLEQFIQDYAQIRSRSTSLIYIIDAHDIKAYLYGSSDHYLDGFIHKAEELVGRFDDKTPIREDVRLKSEQILHWLLFQQKAPVILLPSHEQEVEEAVADLHAEQLSKTIGLVDEARRQIEAARRRVISGEMIDALLKQVNRGVKKAQVDLVHIVRRSAPALANLLDMSPDTSRQRIVALSERSNLLSLSSLDWADFGFSTEISVELSKIAPSASVVEDWREKLATLRTASPRSNRLDGEAIAYVCALNTFLLQRAPASQAVLVTRVESLLRSVRDQRAEDVDTFALAVRSLRHTRLLAAHDREQRMAKVAREDQNQLTPLLAELVVALRTYSRQLGAAPAYSSESQLRQTASSLVKAWSEFEGTKLTLELRERDVSSEHGATPASDETIQEIVRLMSANGTLEQLLIDSLAKRLRRFQHETFSGHFSNMQESVVSLLASDNAQRVLCCPLSLYYLGPIWLSNLTLDRHAEGGPSDGAPEFAKVRVPNDLRSSVDATSVYIAWAIANAVHAQWKAALIYAESAIQSGSALGHAAARAEARLLAAQILRLGGETSQADDKTTEQVTSRLQYARELLAELSQDDPRVAVELVALDVELALTEVRSGWKWLQRLVDLHKALPELQVGGAMTPRLVLRCAELRVLIGCIVCSQGDESVKTHGLRPALFSQWHKDFSARMSSIRESKSYVVGEVPRHARALEIIGYQTLARLSNPSRKRKLNLDALGVPKSLLVDVDELIEVLDEASDQTSKFIHAQLVEALRAQDPQDYNLVFAPVWSKEQVAARLQRILSPALRDGATRAASVVHDVGDRQWILDDDAADEIQYIAEACEQLQQILSANEDLGADVRFFLTMELYYAELLQARAWKDAVGRRHRYYDLAKRYEALLATEVATTSAVLHYRLSVIYSELNEREKAFKSISESLALLEDDESIGRGHWIRSTIRRRIGIFFSSEASDLLQDLYKDPSNFGLRDEYLRRIAQAFKMVYEQTEELDIANSFRARIEEQRRKNNVIYYASLYIRAGGKVEALYADFTQTTLLALVNTLNESKLVENEDWGGLHTIGSAMEAIGNRSKAASIADQLWTLLGKPSEGKSSREVGIVLADAARWKGDANVQRNRNAPD